MKCLIFIFLVAIVAGTDRQKELCRGSLASCQYQCVGINGRDGRDGRNGIDGKNGRDGLDGRDGIDGKDALDGKNGVDGKTGITGRNGTDGRNGVDGKNGIDGKDTLRNWKECAWTKGDGKDNGVIKVCSFKKKSSSTYLKIVASSNMRIAGCDSCCKRWFLTISGAECNDPAPIDGVVYMATGSKENIHRPRVVRGHCKITKTGTLAIALNVGNCAGFGDADALTGWNSSSRIFIEEVNKPQA